LFEINIPNYYITSKRIYDTSILLCTSDQRNNSHEASSCWLGCIARKEEENPLEAHGYGRSRNWTSSRPSGIRQIKKVLLSPFSCERFLQVIPQGSYYWRLMWNPPLILLSSGERKGLKYLSFWVGMFLMPTLFFMHNDIYVCFLLRMLLLLLLITI